MKYIFFVFIIVNTLHAMQEEVNQPGKNLKVWGIVEKYNYGDIETYKALLNNGCTIYTTLTKDGNIKVSYESETLHPEQSEEAKPFGCSWYLYLKDLCEKQYGMK